MAEEILVIPPIRQSLEDVNSAKANDIDQPLTEKSWYLYWQRTGDQVNLNTDKLGKLVTYGTHGGRPPAASMPNAALYMETDRGGAIYQNTGVGWKYRAGTMFGTLSPDQRPTDLGVNDAGFDFRATDVARQFLWSQSQWIEATEAQYGIHSGRPNPNDIVHGALYMETDRGGVIYQNQAGVWRYLAGTMFGTLSPDQRPTGLGVNDGGFDFRGTDQQREFIWSQTAWVEVTPPTSSQSPWTSDIDGAAHRLLNAGAIAIGINNAQNLLDVYSTTNNGNLVLLRGVIGANGDGAGVLFAQNNLSGLQASVRGFYEAVSNGMAISFSTFNGTSYGERMRLTAVGQIYIPGMQASNPGAGSKQLWYDPADGNRVKYAP